MGPDTIPILLICLESVQPAVERAVARHASARTIDEGKIIIKAVPKSQRDPGSLTALLKREAKHFPNGIDAIIVAPLKPPNLLPSNVVLLSSGPLPPTTLEQQRLPPILATRGWHWVDEANRQVAHWQHGVLDQAHVENWLRQFDDLGGMRWVGEALLRGHWMVRPTDLTAGLLAAEPKIPNSVRCVTRLTPGKSGDIIANLLRKATSFGGVGAQAVVDLESALDVSGNTEAIHWFEDGVYSATETLGVIDSLLGQRVGGRTQKARQLTNPDPDWSRVTLTAFYSTDLAERRLHAHLTEKGINLQIQSYHVDNVLTAAGESAISDAEFWEAEKTNALGINMVARTKEWVSPRAFDASLPTWRTPEKRTRAREFCEAIGGQLWKAYLKSNGWQMDRWPDTVIELCSLGMYGIGANLAFAHSVPKATLPLMWRGGKVVWKGFSVEWEPLYPNA